MHRIATDRQRKRDHILWARIHAATLEFLLSWGNHHHHQAQAHHHHHHQHHHHLSSDANGPYGTVQTAGGPSGASNGSTGSMPNSWAVMGSTIRAFSEMVASHAVWENDEVEWVAGICVLRAVIRTAVDRRQRDEFDDLLRTYEGRWKVIKDEARQALVAVSRALSLFFCVF